MKNFNLLILYFCTVLTMCVMYATQPLQPHFEQILEISKFQASIFTTAILVPLAFASIIYGYFLEKISIRKVLIGVFFIFSVSEFIFAFCDSYAVMISIRIMQGFIVPATLTGIMSYISQSVSHTKVASAMGAYIGITIAGGFIGRFLSGFFTDVFGWRFFFILLGILTLIACVLLLKTLDEIKTKFVKPRLRNISQILSIPRNIYIYLAIFGVFFVFQAVLNILPFELVRLDGAFSGSKTGFMYVGYIIGIFISFNVAKIVNLSKTASNAIFIGIIIYIISLGFLTIESFYAIFASMLVFYAGSFTAHSVATAHVNKKATSHKGITNGLYVSFYYAGGALGSFVPGVIYEFGGWNMFLSALAILLCVSLFFIWKLKKYEKSKNLS
ncbi:MFS transporter [Campylobacter sp. CS_ED1]|uniref:MFS transporter n=1 Tax=unclassified Campylobacter TaxID=2593542 RepID=UPI0022E9CBE9|nr:MULTISPECIES: MFS transporter [unclassified Campylobacter]MDA3089608.1 MFS transporter [Campylobacter sp. CS_ED2]MDA3080279.1 MFS transporter [Campylobacter sp. CS_NA2]MDA3081855.1 MFS transporter [Campylobacter sp. CS_NA1]MDA3086336.1 MFS transporter [Campylobacter sp. CS_ED1]WBR51822.1 MFS transporter [Campylobacter sp. CS_NA3]